MSWPAARLEVEAGERPLRATPQGLFYAFSAHSMGLRALILVACACVASAFVPVMPLRSVAPSCSRVTDVQMIVSDGSRTRRHLSSCSPPGALAHAPLGSTR